MIKVLLGGHKSKKKSHDYYSLHETRLERQLRQLSNKEKRQQYILSLLGLAFVALSVSQWWFMSSRNRELIVLHDAGNGSAWITQRKGDPTPSEAATRSNIARYVRMRESYAVSSFAFQYRLINQLSNPDVALSYRKSQSAAKKNSLLRKYGRSGLRKVTIDDIVLLPFKQVRKSETIANQSPFAEVHFTTVDMPGNTHHPKITGHTALLSWQYHGMPSDPEERLNNWMGFQVHYYEVTDRR